jgi:predicted naringenin-chalcone synthase
MAVRVRTIQTAVPNTALAQTHARDLFAAQPDLTRLGRRLVTASFDASGIDTRYTVIDELAPGASAGAPVFVDPDDGHFLVPSTRTRNERYIDHAAPLTIEAARKALGAVDGIDAGDITHVVTVSCTGFSAPGPDYALVRGLGLSPQTQRFHVGFMGCYGAFPALKMAKAFCDSEPDAVVLVVSVELCTLHMRSSNEPDQIVASSVFGDGAAAALVTARDLPGDVATLELDRFATTLTPVGEDAMAWTIGDQGFDMVLSSYVPKIIDEHIEGALAPLFPNARLFPDAPNPGSGAGDIDLWAIHPGGRSILDRVQAKLGLSDAQLDASRGTLRDFGNMSSATIFFVLKRLLESGGVAEGDQVCAMAFGPGLTVEAGLFTVRMPVESAPALQPDLFAAEPPFAAGPGLAPDPALAEV